MRKAETYRAARRNVKRRGRAVICKFDRLFHGLTRREYDKQYFAERAGNLGCAVRK